MRNKLEKLERIFNEEIRHNKRNAAEYCYAMATIAKDLGDTHKARQYAQRAIEIFEEINIQTLENAAAINNIIEGVVIPELIHENVVRARFQALLDK